MLLLEEREHRRLCQLDVELEMVVVSNSEHDDLGRFRHRRHHCDHMLLLLDRDDEDLQDILRYKLHDMHR